LNGADALLPIDDWGEAYGEAASSAALEKVGIDRQSVGWFPSEKAAWAT